MLLNPDLTIVKTLALYLKCHLLYAYLIIYDIAM